MRAGVCWIDEGSDNRYLVDRNLTSLWEARRLRMSSTRFLRDGG